MSHENESAPHTIIFGEGAQQTTLVVELTPPEVEQLEIIKPGIQLVRLPQGYDVNNAYAGADRVGIPGQQQIIPNSMDAAGFLDDNPIFDPFNDIEVREALRKVGSRTAESREISNKASAAAAASASRQIFFQKENERLRVEHETGVRQRDEKGFAQTAAYNSASDSLNLADLAARQSYSAESAALSLQDAKGNASFTQSQLDRNLEGIGLDAVDYRRGESVTADPYRALEADQTGAASGQRRYAQDVRAAAAASEEKKILLAEQRVAEARADTDRQLGLALQQLSAGQANSDRALGFAMNQSRLDSQWRTDQATLAEDNRIEGIASADKSGIARARATNGFFTTSDGVEHNFILPIEAATTHEEQVNTVISGPTPAELAAKEAARVRATNSYSNVAGVVV